MTDGTGFETSDEIVAKRIIARFVETGLLPAQYANKTLLAQLATGKMRAEEWRLLVENSLALEMRQRNDQ